MSAIHHFALTILVAIFGVQIAFAQGYPTTEAEKQARINEVREEFANHHYTAQCEIVRQVHESIGWEDHEFKVSYWLRNSDHLQFVLSHISAAENSAAGAIGGAAHFVVLVDPKTNRVVSIGLGQ
ncbi:MAG: hypothetical protein ACPG06_09000 [Alphaproteobacteria bacterium]